MTYDETSHRIIIRHTNTYHKTSNTTSYVKNKAAGTKKPAEAGFFLAYLNQIITSD
jgi:hypothetical protein